MSNIVPWKRNQETDVIPADLHASSHDLEPLEVYENGKWGFTNSRMVVPVDTNATVSNFSSRAKKFLNSKIQQGTLIGAAGGAGVDVLLIPLFLADDALLYTVGAPIPVTLAVIGAALGYRAGKKITDKAKNFFLKGYAQTTEQTFQETYGKRFTEDDMLKMTAIITGLEPNRSSYEFEDLTDKRKYKLIQKDNKSAWQLVHAGMWNVPIKQQEAFDAAHEVLAVFTAGAVNKMQKLRPSTKQQIVDHKDPALQTVENKINVLKKIKLAVEDQYLVEKAEKDVQESVDLASQLSLLKDKAYLDSYSESLKLVEETLDKVIAKYQDAIRNEFLAEREKYTPKDFKLN